MSVEPIATTQPPARSGGRAALDFVRHNLHNIGLPVVVAILVVTLALSSDLFLTARNLRNVGLEVAALAAVSFGQTVVILTAGLDLSVGAIMVLSSVVMGQFTFRYGLPPGVEEPVCDGWTEINAALSAELGAFIRGELSQAELDAAREVADYRYQEKVRRRVETTVRNPDTVEKLKAWYRFNCKRPTFNDEYLDTFNLPNVTLLDVSDTQGVERITETGIVANGVEYPVDCIIYASGFEITSEMRRRLGIEVIEGRGGRSLFDYWGDGFRTFHGWISDGFPNQFFTGYTQGAVAANLTLMLDYQTQHIAHVIAQTRKRGALTVEATLEAVEHWQEVMRDHRVRNDKFLSECTPGYYNNEGGAVKRSHLGESYAPGVAAFTALLEGWRDQGDLWGLKLES